MKPSGTSLSRRQFLQKSSCAAGLLAAGSAAFAAPQAESVAVDPRLLQYERQQRFPSLCAEPRRLALGPDKRLYIAAKQGITVLALDGTAAGALSLTAPARCIAVSGEGIIYAGLRDHIEVFDAKGQRSGGWDVPGAKSWLTGLAVGPNDLYAADAGNRVVLRFDHSGKLLGRIGEKNKDRNVAGLIVPSPYLAVALAPDGLLRVNNPGRHRIEAYTPNGDLESFWGVPAGSIQGFCGCCNPVGLALMRDGSCVTAEKGMPRAKTYSADGTLQALVAGPEAFPENGRVGAVNNKSDGLLGGLDVAVDEQGTIFVLDLVAENISVWRKKA